MSEATIDRDLPCRGCGYNLRGLSPAGRCPECSTNVATSLQPTALSLSQPGHFRVADAGARMILAVCCWEILSKAGWILILFRNMPVQWIRPVELICREPAAMVLVCLLQNVALFAFSALARSQFRIVLFVLGMILIAMLIPFCIGHRFDTRITVLAQAFVAVIFYPRWLGYAWRLAASAGDDLLARRFRFMQWRVPAALAIYLLGILVYSSFFAPALIVTDAAIIALSAWMIFLVLRLRTTLQRITPSDGAGDRNALAPQEPRAQLLRHGQRWLSRAHAGLLMEGIWLGLVLVFPISSFLNSRLASSAISASEDLPRDLHLTAVRIVGALVGAAQLFFIWWMSSSPPDEPRQDGPSARMTLRQWLRLFTAFWFFASLVIPFDELLRMRPPEPMPAILALLHGGFFFCLFLFIEKDLAVHADDPDVREQAAILKWFLPLLIETTPLLLIAASNGLIGRASALALNHLQHMLIIVSGLWAIWLLYWLSRSFARAADAAKPS